MSKKMDARKVAELREKLLPAALRMVYPMSYRPPLTEEQRQRVAEEACMLAHSLALAAFEWDRLIAEAQRTDNARTKDFKTRLKAVKKAAANGDDATLAAIIKGGTP